MTSTTSMNKAFLQNHVSESSYWNVPCWRHLYCKAWQNISTLPKVLKAIPLTVPMIKLSFLVLFIKVVLSVEYYSLLESGTCGFKVKYSHKGDMNVAVAIQVFCNSLPVFIRIFSLLFMSFDVNVSEIVFICPSRY